MVQWIPSPDALCPDEPQCWQPRRCWRENERCVSYHQRCAVRVTYLNNRARGQWKAHGRYLARESATFDNDAKAVGFSRESNAIDIAARLESWQAAGDERFWKLIVSPEFGDRVDLSSLTRGLIERMEDDLGTALEWTAVTHHNTEHRGRLGRLAGTIPGSSPQDCP